MGKTSADEQWYDSVAGGGVGWAAGAAVWLRLCGSRGGGPLGPADTTEEIYTPRVILSQTEAR